MTNFIFEDWSRIADSWNYHFIRLKTLKRRAIRIVQRLAPDWRPRRFNTDLESGIRQAIQEVYPDATICLCYFHLLGCFSRNASNYGIKNDLLFRNGKFQRFWLKLRALPFMAMDVPNVRAAVIHSLRNEIANYRKSSLNITFIFKQTSKKLWKRNGRVEKVDQLNLFFERYIFKNFLQSRARVKPEYWSKPISEEMYNETFVITTSSSEQIHSEIKRECCSSTRTLKNSINVLYRLMKQKEIDRRNFVESGQIRKRINNEVYIRQAITLGQRSAVCFL